VDPRRRRGYDAALERISIAIAPYVESVLGPDRDLTVLSDTAYLYRTPDATHLVETTYERLREAIDVDGFNLYYGAHKGPRRRPGGPDRGTRRRDRVRHV